MVLVRNVRAFWKRSAASIALVLPVLAWADDDMDRRIEHAARSSYNFRALLDKQVMVEAEAGVVTLRGSVLNRGQWVVAEETVRDLPGVVGVRNELIIATPERERADGWIALRIRSLLLMRPKVSVATTDVTVHDGIVTLTGSVDSVLQRELTEAYARSVQGVRDVRNHLRVAESGVTEAGEVLRTSPLPESPAATDPPPRRGA